MDYILIKVNEEKPDGMRLYGINHISYNWYINLIKDKNCVELTKEELTYLVECNKQLPNNLQIIDNVVSAEKKIRKVVF